MDIPQNNASQNNFPGVPPRNSGHFWKMIVLFLTLLVVVIGAYLLWEAFYGSNAKEARDQAANYAQYQKGTFAYEEAMRNDTYGGKTPEETLQLFTDALKKGDVELASKYFELPKENQDKWKEKLNNISKSGNLERMGKDLENYDSKTTDIPTFCQFIYKNNDGTTGLQLTLHSQESGLWKIENF